jgi:hypothetical protein
MAEDVSTMAENTQIGIVPPPLLSPAEVVLQTSARLSPNGIRFATFGDLALGAAPTSAGSPAALNPEPHPEIARLVQAVPVAIAAALTEYAYYFVPLVLTEARPTQPAAQSSAQSAQPGTQPTQSPAAPASHRASRDETMISPIYTPDLADLAICHRNVELDSTDFAEAVFISTRLLSDRFSLAFEFFINVGHAFVDAAGIPQSFADLAWNQALADVRGETSHDAWETRALALNPSPRTPRTLSSGPPPSLSSRTLSGSKGEGPASSPKNIDEKSRNEFLEAAFADSVAIYLLSLAVDFDYSELREREYPLLAPPALAERLRLTHSLFPPNPTYDFAIRYRRRP